jgi:hypothetical protein
MGSRDIGNGPVVTELEAEAGSFGRSLAPREAERNLFDQ